MNFKNLAYLKSGTVQQQEIYRLLTEYRIMDKLQGYNPVLIGTFPIDIAVEGSDLDICCQAKDLDAFLDDIDQRFKEYDFYQSCSCLIGGVETVVANLQIQGYPIELFAQNRPVEQQNGYQHMIVEYKILLEKGALFKQKVIALKKAGMKTEPAFAKLLNLSGDPYLALLKYRDTK
ncbi:MULTISPECIES: DUF4269 domain-containing protein [Myroides]|uniref:DUF4269 domain-containing protein n=1 Tax=Myroides albus TaxID=2562892 RepID=A0A6I3LQK9_9FLAO|nr:MULTISPECIES: DUF4269 domain-containing protein [Myroides]MTG98235.1 DUF4269 domain-containing protein [Myroides albus]MVX35014.1 DUF4269 domain-containing protein [Myroides sp. LoEW2-1]